MTDFLRRQYTGKNLIKNAITIGIMASVMHSCVNTTTATTATTATTTATTNDVAVTSNDSSTVMQHEATDFLNTLKASGAESYTSAEVKDNTIMYVTMNADDYNTVSSQDQEMVKKRLYSVWYAVYKQHHNYQSPSSLMLVLLDLNGDRISSYY